MLTWMTISVGLVGVFHRKQLLNGLVFLFAHWFEWTVMTLPL